MSAWNYCRATTELHIEELSDLATQPEGERWNIPSDHLQSATSSLDATKPRTEPF